MLGLMLFSFSCAQDVPSECPDPLIAVQETERLHGEIDRLSSTNREIKRTNDQLKDQLDLFKADLIDSQSIDAIFYTSRGVIRCVLFPQEAPKAVSNFVHLAEGRITWEHPKTKQKSTENFYDNTIFHRVVANQLIQGGDPSGLGTGGPGYSFPDEKNRYRFDQGGRLAMANTGANTNGSQFFISVNAKPDWDGTYTIFGQCDNLDLVKEISLVDSNDDQRPLKLVDLTKVRIERNK
jgi:peptidyl-prolyl cis-trans isomerase A (cyclophilin A)